MNFNDAIPVDNKRSGGQRHLLRRGLVATVIGVVLFSATACGSDTATDAVPTADTVLTTDPPSTTDAPPTTSTTMAPPASSPSSTPATPATPTTISAATPPRPTATVDELVDIDGVRLHVRCVGTGDTTVLLIAGFEVGDENWGKVEPDIAARARVCSYARPGTGTSDPASSMQTFTTQARQLSELLTTIGEPGPYVLAGHSFGGAEAITFASQHADQVSGLVLIDASPASWPTELCAAADDGSDMAILIRSNCVAWTDPTANVEHLDVFASFAEVSGIDSLGSLPMTVITAVDRGFAGLAAPELARLTEAWNQGQQRWSGLSTTSHVVSVENTIHHIELDRPDVVIEAIVGMLP